MGTCMAAVARVLVCSRVALMILIAGLLGLPALALAQSSVTMNPTSGPAGTRVDATGSGFTPSSMDLNAFVDIFWDLNFDGIFLTEAMTDNLGNFTVSFDIPRDATVGEHQVTFSDSESAANDQTFGVFPSVVLARACQEAGGPAGDTAPHPSAGVRP
jgi:hypothetical protein